MTEIIYYCKCGFETPIATGMFLHLSYPENQNPEHGYYRAAIRHNYPKE